MLAVRTNNLFLALLVKIKVLVAYAVSKNYVVVILLIILSYTVLFPFELFPLNRCWWFACNVIHYAVNVSYFIYDTCRDFF